jgi:hypothetical protein
MQTDPMKQYWSPYTGMGNNPVSKVDPTGGCDYLPCNTGGYYSNGLPPWLYGDPHYEEYSKAAEQQAGQASVAGQVEAAKANLAAQVQNFANNLNNTPTGNQNGSNLPDLNGGYIGDPTASTNDSKHFFNEPWYGNFLGPGPDANPYTLLDPNNKGGFLQPIDAVDKAAQKHDFAYWQAGVSGISGAMFNKAVKDADRQLVSDAKAIMKAYNKKENDPVTGLPISDDAYKWAQRIDIAFDLAISGKTPLPYSPYY